MGGIYINGMEMPTDERVRVVIYQNGQVFVDHGTWFSEYEAISVPPHGGLIEKNAVFKLIQSMPSVDKLLPVEFMKALQEIPTVIPAEEG